MCPLGCPGVDAAGAKGGEGAVVEGGSDDGAGHGGGASGEAGGEVADFFGGDGSGGEADFGGVAGLGVASVVGDDPGSTDEGGDEDVGEHEADEEGDSAEDEGVGAGLGGGPDGGGEAGNGEEEGEHKPGDQRGGGFAHVEAVAFGGDEVPANVFPGEVAEGGDFDLAGFCHGCAVKVTDFVLDCFV